ncbi:calcium-binding protein [Acuticoccus yangtzensis]|uniref:calcium-binding protein n=1 Tax=Acuticoccus yangtzensis TaxID=1443441 RepID=UPI000B017F13|nr:calcium-binding protein [Acuticoccus yangtzensis]
MRIIRNNRVSTVNFGIDELSVITNPTTVSTTDDSPAVRVVAGNPLVMVNGEAISGDGNGVELNGGDRLIVTGTVQGGEAGVAAGRHANTVFNTLNGTIIGDEVGVRFDTRPGGDNLLLNAGNIVTGTANGVIDGAEGSNQTLRIVNSGTIGGTTALNAGDDVYVGLARGTATVEGGAGADLLVGSLAGDSLAGGDGADRLFGRFGADAIADGETGDQSNDLLNGGSGNDTLTAGTGIDTLNGGLGDDLLLGSSPEAPGIALADGGAGADTFHFTAGISELYGRSGADTFTLGSGIHRVDTGGGADTVIIEGPDALTGTAAITLTGLSRFDTVDISNYAVANLAALLAQNGTQAGGDFVLDLTGDGSAVLTFEDMDIGDVAETLIA